MATAISSLYALYSVLAKLFFNQAPRGFTALVTLTAFIFGVQLIFFGIYRRICRSYLRGGRRAATVRRIESDQGRRSYFPNRCRFCKRFYSRKVNLQVEPEYSREYHDLYRRRRWGRAREEAIIDVLQRNPPEGGFGHILDVGCGDGLLFDRQLSFGEVGCVERDTHNRPRKSPPATDTCVSF